MKYKFLVPSVIFAFTLLNQGGFYGGSVVFCGLLISAALIFTKLSFEKKYIPFLIFCAWYLFCSARDGVMTESVARGLIPTVTLLYFLSLTNMKKSDMIGAVLKISAAAALVAVVKCPLSFLSKGVFPRALFPFQYSNACGIYFGACYLLSIDADDTFIKRTKYIFLAALILTQSVGAVGLTFLALVIYRKNIRYTAVIFACGLIGAFVLRNRLIESYATFVERLLQIHDGTLCILKNPIFGIGAGNWENARKYFQTGFYESTFVHSSIVGIGVSSGVIGIVLFVAAAVFALKDAFRDKGCFFAACIIMIHSFLDFSLSFLAICMFLAVLTLTEKEENKDTRARFFARKGVAAASFALFLALSLCFSQISIFCDEAQTDENAPIIGHYEAKPVLCHSIEAREEYIYALYKGGDTEGAYNAIKAVKYPSPRLMMLRVRASEDPERELKECLELQPFNIALYRFTDRKECRRAAEKRMSYLGKLLSELEGK